MSIGCVLREASPTNKQPLISRSQPAILGINFGQSYASIAVIDKVGQLEEAEEEVILPSADQIGRPPIMYRQRGRREADRLCYLLCWSGGGKSAHQLNVGRAKVDFLVHR